MRDKGAGGIYQRAADGAWCASLELPSRDGKRRRKVIVRARRDDVVTALRAARKELERTGDLSTASPPLSVWLTQWLEQVAAPRLKPRTLAGYRGYVDRYIVPAIGRIHLDKLTPAHVRRLHEYIADQGLSTTTALQAHRILAKALTDAEREGRIPRNPATLLDAPRKAVAVRPALTADDAAALLRSVASRPDEAAHWSLALLAGLRQGERLGLTRDQIDLDAGVLTVAWQVQRLTFAHGCGGKAGAWRCGKKRAGSCPERHVRIPSDQEAVQIDGGLWMTRPKSRAGWRQVPVVGLLHDVLTRYMAQTEPGMHGLLLHRGDGRPVDPHDDSVYWHAALAEAGLPDVPLHSARHTCATLLHALGADQQTRMSILGHSSATTTAGYTHVTNAIAGDAMLALSQKLAGLIESPRG